MKNDIEIGRELAEFVVKTEFTDLPDEVVEFTKGLTLKTVAGMTAGSVMPAGKRVVKFMRERGGLPEARVIGCNFKASLWNAAFAQAIFAHASELEDDRFDGGVSWDITTFPLIFPLAEQLRLSGKDLILASAVGLEVHSRTCLFTTEHLGVTVVPGSVGPAAAAAKALRLNVEETMSALGLALSGVGVSLSNFGTDAHYFESALQCLQGLMSAELAKEGLTGNPDIGTYLINLLGEDKITPEKIVEELGVKWLFREIWIKKYPCCFLTHRQIDLLLELMKKHDLSYEQIEEIDAHAGPIDFDRCNRPEPQTIGDLQFSFQHVLAAVMLDKDVNFDHITAEKIFDAKFKEARSKVKLVLHSDWPVVFNSGVARVVAKLKDGTEFTKEREYPIGSPKQPLTRDQLKELYYKFVRRVTPEDQIERIASTLLNLEKLSNMEELMDMLCLSLAQPDRP
ncbi:MmgE/PrpD family protein [Chloroflexota bacterium]